VFLIVADTTQLFPGITAEQAAMDIVERVHVAGVPASDFLGPEVKTDPKRSTFIRFMFSVEDEVLLKAADNLRKL